jgi:hypothetical protein
MCSESIGGCHEACEMVRLQCIEWGGEVVKNGQRALANRRVHNYKSRSVVDSGSARISQNWIRLESLLHDRIQNARGEFHSAIGLSDCA